ncbi:SDR family NAD(P)-dependent oxidoreductase [Mucilaginibacter sp. X4EP1]|uniref:SDR family NAD(P)-dependent oxidoreductase n=1 Tax=Mucilaginibacter sp. X4EP1 TaxID=2723092 RepID=UPI002168F2BD|nr:SDR family NAD(P)-dependent oxidoreductase [Mucilaginibacter sp. X4EP1]MCS3811904.1 short-subunit dehydrogenase [Mucilaginibacter sp. X4EP1]
MDKYFNNKIIWITGASSGIGEALAWELSRRGAKLILSSRRIAELERVKNNCAHPDNVHILPLDLTDSANLEAKVPLAIALFGHIDIMVHNGGISQRALVAETDIAVHREVMELNYFSYITLTKALLPHFIARGSGYFVVTSSVMGKIGTPMRAAYAAAKHALHGYFDCLRAEVGQYGIKVTILTPGYIHTPIATISGDGSFTSNKSEHINAGFSADKAALQIIKAIQNEAYEPYIGKFIGEERLALFVKRFLPGLFTRLISRFGTPK